VDIPIRGPNGCSWPKTVSSQRQFSAKSGHSRGADLVCKITGFLNVSTPQDIDNGETFAETRPWSMDCGQSAATATLDRQIY